MVHPSCAIQNLGFSPSVFVAGQLSQSAYFSLQLPYTLLGLGRSANFLDHLFVGIPRHPGETVRKYDKVICLYYLVQSLVQVCVWERYMMCLRDRKVEVGVQKANKYSISFNNVGLKFISKNTVFFLLQLKTCFIMW